jgi:hypothetical protein
VLLGGMGWDGVARKNCELHGFLDLFLAVGGFETF